MGGILGTVMRQVVDDLTAGGIAATDNPAAIDPPCAVVEIPRLERLTGCAQSATVTVVLVAPGAAATADALAVLDDLLTAALTIVDPDTVNPATYVLPQTGDTAPALLLTFERTVSQ